MCPGVGSGLPRPGGIACPRTVLILLRGAAAHAAGALDDAVAKDRHGALAHDHVSAGGSRDPARRRMLGPLGQLATRAAERRRGDRLALAAIGAGPDRVVHALERHQPAACVAYRDADPDVEFARLGD